jgi:hypothetical protein
MSLIDHLAALTQNVVAGYAVFVQYNAHNDAVTSTARAAGSMSGWTVSMPTAPVPYLILRSARAGGGAVLASIPTSAITAMAAVPKG